MQYTLRNVPAAVDRALAGEPVIVRELRDLAGTWADDPEFDAALAAQDQIDPDLWR